MTPFPTRLRSLRSRLHLRRFNGHFVFRFGALLLSVVYFAGSGAAPTAGVAVTGVVYWCATVVLLLAALPRRAGSSLPDGLFRSAMWLDYAAVLALAGADPSRTLSLLAFALVPAAEAALLRPLRLGFEGLLGALAVGVASVVYKPVVADIGTSPAWWLQPVQIMILAWTSGACVLLLIRHAEERRRLLATSHVDPVTGLLNRTGVIDRARELFALLERSGDALTVVYVDIDRFGAINDTHGFEAADRVLVELGQALRRVVRGYDHVARLAGDRFVVLLPGANDARVGQIVQRMRMSCGGVGKSAAIPVVVHFGTSCAPWDGANLEQLIASAEQAMRIEKAHRNYRQTLTQLPPLRTPVKKT